MNATDLTIESSTVNQRVYDKICALLTEGRWEPGERLDERALSQQLGVSRTPLREAIGRLATEGVVVHRPYQGNFVRAFTPQQVYDLFDVRKALESMAASRAAELMSDAELEELSETVDRCHRALSEGSMDEFEAADRAFHQQIIRGSRNEALQFSLRLLELHIQLARHMANTQTQLREDSRAHRDGVVHALRERDGAAAARHMGAHLSAVQDAVQRRLVEDAPEGEAS